MVLTTVEETQAPEKARYLLARTQQQIADTEAGPQLWSINLLT